MTGSSGRASVLVWIAAAILLYFVVSVPYIASGVLAMPVMATVSLIAAVTFLVAAWAWMLYSAVKGAPERARRFRTWAWLVVLFLVGLATIPGTRPVVLPALLLTVPFTFLTWMGRGAVAGWRWVVVPFVLVPLVFNEFYFGAVLVLIGVTRMPRRAGAYFRELFPRSVGGSS